MSLRTSPGFRWAALTAAATAAALAVVVPDGGHTDQRRPAAELPERRAAGSVPVAAVSNPATREVGSTVASVPGLPGTLYYVRDSAEPDRMVRLTRSGPETVLGSDGLTANVSPDGSRIAWIRPVGEDGAGNVMIGDRNGRHRRTLLRGTPAVGWEPVWSPDSTRLLVARGSAGRPVPGVLNARTGAFTPLRHDPRGVHYLWSGDGRRLGFATGECRLGVADVDGRNVRLVPVVGVVDAVLFGADDSMLVRSEANGRRQLTVVTAAGTILAQVGEPAEVGSLSLLAYVSG